MVKNRIDPRFAGRFGNPALPPVNNKVPNLKPRKLFQINGAIGHTDYNFSILRTGQFNSLPSLFRGLNTKLSNMAVYSLLYCWVLGG